MINRTPPELFVQPPVRSSFGSRRGAPLAWRRLIVLIVLFCVFCGAVGGAGYWLLSSDDQTPAEIPTIKAEGPLKERPEHPGGIEIPHQNELVFQKIDNANAEKPPTVEHLLPEPAAPQPVEGTSAHAAPSTEMSASAITPPVAVAATTAAPAMPAAQAIPAASNPTPAATGPASSSLAPSSLVPSSAPVSAPASLSSGVNGPAPSKVEVLTPPEHPSSATIASTPSSSLPGGSTTANDQAQSASSEPISAKEVALAVAPKPTPTPLPQQRTEKAEKIEKIEKVKQNAVKTASQKPAAESVPESMFSDQNSSAHASAATKESAAKEAKEEIARAASEEASHKEDSHQGLAGQESAKTTGKSGVQLGSFPEKATAQAELAKMEKRYASQLGDTALRIVPAHISGKGTYYRVQGLTITEAKARAICAALSKQKAACLVIKP